MLWLRVGIRRVPDWDSTACWSSFSRLVVIRDNGPVSALDAPVSGASAGRRVSS